MKLDDHLVALLRRPAPELEDYNALRCLLEAQGAGTSMRTIAVTSPLVGDGKTTTSINLAGVLAHGRDARVLLVDADLRRPSMASLLGLDRTGLPGLAEAVAHSSLALVDVVTPIPECGVDVLMPSAPIEDPFEVLRSPRLATLLDQARGQYDMVVLDTSPLLLVPDARLLESVVDGVLLVVAAHRTPRKLVAQAINLLDRSKLAAVVLNRHVHQPSGYGYGVYGYGTYTPRRSGVRPHEDQTRWAAS